MKYRIKDWDKHFENNRTRDLKKMAWVPMPNKHDGDGYTELLDHANGAAHYGAWCALVQVASKCDVRGTLMRDTEKPYDQDSLSRVTRIPAKVWKEALPRLISIGWLEAYDNTAGECGETAGECALPEGNGMEGNGKKERENKIAYGEFKNVKLTEEEYNKLISIHGHTNTLSAIEILDSAIEAKGYKYKNHYAVLKEGSWVWDRVKAVPSKPASKPYKQITAENFGVELK